MIIAVWCTHKLEVVLIQGYTILIFQTATPIRAQSLFLALGALVRPGGNF